MTSPITWAGSTPSACDLCSRPLGAGQGKSKTFYDAKTRMGPWGCLCQGCFRTNGLGVGTGLGQRFELRPDGRWHKTAG